MGFIDFMLKDKRLLGYTNLFSLNDYEKHVKIILKIFSITKKMKKSYCVISGKYRKFENLKYHNSHKKHYFLKLFAVSARMKMKIYLRKKNQLKY